MLRRLPVDLSTFSELRKSNYVYIDKTEYAYKMITGGRRFFLSRPRRFGKSLLISTLKEILTARNKQLFNDLWINQSDYHWHEYAVINFDFSTLPINTLEDLENGLQHAIINIARVYEIDMPISSSSHSIILLNDLVNVLYKKFNRVAILVDEYDSPILKTLHNGEFAQTIRDKIQQFFTTIKGLDEQIHFVFITGVSSFAKAGLFSGINNLQILTLNKQFSGICGYSDQEVDHYFSEHMHTWAQQESIPYDTLRQQIKTWYNGYHFGNKVAAVYNPFSVMNALHIQEFKNFWFQSGTPTFLVEILKKECTHFDPDNLETTEDALGIFNVGNIPLIPLMFQAGYLTIVGYDPDTGIYKLDYPNLEVQKSFQKYLLEVFAHINPSKAELLSAKLKAAFYKSDIEEAVSLIKQLFAHIPYQIHGKEEKFYHALLMMVCVSAGIKAQSEYSTSHGRIDLILDTPKLLYVIEVKFNQSAEEALQQIIERRYYERFLAEKKPIILIGLAFKREPHNFDIMYAMKKL